MGWLIGLGVLLLIGLVLLVDGVRKAPLLCGRHERLAGKDGRCPQCREEDAAKQVT